MDVVDDLRVPDVVDLGDEGAGFGLGEDVPVAVVVVADVLLVEDGRGGAFVGGVEGFAVPVGDEVEAVGVDGGDEQEDGVGEDLLYLGVVGGGEAV